MCKDLLIPKDGAKFYFAITLILLLTMGSYGQSRSNIRQQITERGECRNVAITKTNGDLMLYGRNGYAGTRLPGELSSTMDKLNNDNVYIDDVQLTENGSWLVLWGNNGLQWQGISSGLERKLRESNSNNEVITSVTFNDDGDWIVITTKHYSSSDSRITNWLKEGSGQYGLLWAACVTDDAVVAVYERGYTFFGNVPESLKKALNETRLDVYRLKIAGTAWFFADKDGSYQYSM